MVGFERDRGGDSVGHAAAAPSTMSVVSAAGDEVSASVARLFGGYAQQYQALSAQTVLFHERFLQALTSGASAYAGAEAANVSPLHALGQELQALAIFSPVKDLTGRPLLGDGADAARGAGRRWGWRLDFGSGGNGG